MRNSITLIATFTAVSVLGLAGCDVKKTQEGNITVPSMDIKTGQEKAEGKKKSSRLPRALATIT